MKIKTTNIRCKEVCITRNMASLYYVEQPATDAASVTQFVIQGVNPSALLLVGVDEALVKVPDTLEEISLLDAVDSEIVLDVELCALAARAAMLKTAMDLRKAYIMINSKIKMSGLGERA